MLRITLSVAVAWVVLSASQSQEASAQIGTRNRPGSFIQSYISNRPTVSPWLNLLRNDGGINNISNYQTLVRPLLEQRQQASMQTRQISQLQSQVASQRSQAAQQSQTGVRPTGHPTRYLNYLQFFPLNLQYQSR